ncbi:hypothetical protein LOTGIDRAFT_168201 [Lottia gigantea]|uniref:LUC7-like protein n=1 Tax=Lottia gigantea TaxID=225164 RepID=V3ZQZ8_LOTGI|nr:hypothetical protein LOTGIDRAFT_168201 [Lottia gigantea]ESO84945.1 hypothetical protein LOTGIDRAFT_168201 [Lottia gigantea]
MSAHDQMRAMLDQLMGTARDGEGQHKEKFDGPRVCKSFLLACCPNDILASTRMDLGECAKIHDLALRADYEAAAKTKDYYYDIDAMEHLQNFIADCDRKMELAKKRLKETQEELSEDANSKAEKILQLGEQIGVTLAKAEELGAEGNVEESLIYMQKVEELKAKKSAEEQEYRNQMPASSYQQQKLRVCEVCGAYLGIHDNDRRLADHFGGKLHLGFISIREKLDELQVTHFSCFKLENSLLAIKIKILLEKSVADRRVQREKEREEMRKAREDRDKEREESRKQRSISKEKSRDRGSDRDRERGGDRDRERSDRDRKRRSRSRKRLVDNL